MSPDSDTRNVIDEYKGMAVAAIKDQLASSAFRLHVAIENYQHDYNIGTIVRSANAFNVAGVHIVGRRHWNRRGAMATEKYLTLYHHPTINDFVDWVRLADLQLIGIDNVAGAKKLGNTLLPTGTVYVFGQEGPGLSPEMQAQCQSVIAIEQFGSTRSVNVGVAAGIVLYEWVRQNALDR